MNNPKFIDVKLKNACINQNILQSGYQTFKMCPYAPSVNYRYLNKYSAGQINNICKVYVFLCHPIDLIEQLSPKGLNTLTSNKSYPAMLYPMGRDFLGSNFESRDGIVDETLILRSNYAFVIKKQRDLFPIKKDGDVIYSKIITIIRDMYYNFLNYDNIFRSAVITASPPKDIELITEEVKIDDEKKKVKILSSKDFLKFQTMIESVFQVAICGNHECLILTVFSTEFNIPVDDQILIYNNCIMKYGHKFKDIVIAIPPFEGKELMEYFDKNIIKPIELTKHIDMKYETEIFSQSLMNAEPEEENDENSKNIRKIANMSTEEKNKLVKGIMKNKKKDKSKSK